MNDANPILLAAGYLFVFVGLLLLCAGTVLVGQGLSEMLHEALGASPHRRRPRNEDRRPGQELAPHPPSNLAPTLRRWREIPDGQPVPGEDEENSRVDSPRWRASSSEDGGGWT